MEKSIFEQMGGTYRQEGDHLLPNLTVPKQVPVGVWGQRRKRYLREHRRALYTALLLDGELDANLTDIDHQAEEMFSLIIEKLAKQEGITEQFKENNQIEWVRRMNNIRNRVEEIIFNEYICY